MSGVGARQVGEFIPSNRQIIKSMRNPLDKATIISIFPKKIRAVKYTIQPGLFEIPAGTFKEPAILVVGGSSWWSDRSVDSPILEIPVSSVSVANAVIRDYAVGMLGCNMADLMPGLFYVPGEISVAKVKAEYSERLKEAKTKQDAWFMLLTRLADSLWARANGNPLVISDEMRLAARELNFNDKPWLRDFQRVEMVKCKGCGGLRNEEYPICPHCKLIDTTHAMAKELKFAT